MFKNISKYTWFSFIPFMCLGAITIALIIMNIIPVQYLFATLLGWTLISGLGIAVGYHRIFSHKTHPNLPLWKENFILFLGSLGGQGSSITWTAIHRGYHHRFADTDRDIHSPKHGIYHAFFGWANQITENNPGISLKYASDLLRKPNHIWFHQNHFKILWLAPIVVSLFDWKLSLCLLCLPTALSLLQDNTINIVGHLPLGIGYRNFDTHDNSHNNVVMGYLGWGQGWHNNHHHSPGSFDFGSSVSGRWWEWDPCRIWLPLLK
jgi:stearoyl-CoA desaturase (delta-9 desaturase)